ncbi:SHOCT domain-containing protein [Haloplasma contractile]|uniref:Membrane protein n=1 Tax=Haloplasma contractile SSD-17B TaxID=1033810 RepID=F7PV16_9MOLU|nr:hypothetical protein [Haloplasma contractile]ERJ11251.1 Putative membrane protein [Haloplasma contractile SSD-17B]
MMYGYRNGFDCGGFGGYDGFLGQWSFLIPLLIIGIVIYLVFKLMNQDHRQNKDSLINELKMKYINGEISEQEYLQKKKLISK